MKDKRRARAKSLAQPSADKMVKKPEIKKDYPRICPYCGKEGYSTICKCGRLTKLRVL